MRSKATKDLYKAVLRNYLTLKLGRAPSDEEIIREGTVCGVGAIVAEPDEPDYDALARAHEVPSYHDDPDEIDMTYWHKDASVNRRSNGEE